MNKLPTMEEFEKTLYDLRDLSTRLILLAGEMALRKNMPDFELWDWPKRTTNKILKQADHACSEADEQCKLWAIAIRDVADKLSAMLGVRPQGRLMRRFVEMHEAADWINARAAKNPIPKQVDGTYSHGFDAGYALGLEHARRALAGEIEKTPNTKLNGGEAVRCSG